MLPDKISKQLSIIVNKYLDPEKGSELMEEMSQVASLNGNVKNAFLDVKMKLQKEIKKKKDKVAA